MNRAGDPVIQAVFFFLEKFKSPATLLVALSGGSDSTGLVVALDIALATGRYPHISFLACTVDHGLRAGSADEAAAVGAWCRQRGIAHRTERWEGDKPATGLQAAAREARYRLLVRAAGAAGADAILTAHTMDDQRETVAMRSARASDGVGLSGMAEAVLLEGRTWLLRPLLGVARNDIRMCLKAHNVGWIEDPSNRNRRFERVRVRGQVDHVAGSDAGERHAIAERAAGFLGRHARLAAPFLVHVDAEGVDAAPGDDAVWRGLRMLAATLGGRVHGWDAAGGARIRTFLASGTLSRLTAGRVVFDRRRDGLYLYRESRGIVPLPLAPGEARLWDGRLFVRNRSARPIVISTTRDVPVGEVAGVPPGVLRRAGFSAPRQVFEDGSQTDLQDLSVLPVIAPYRTFLPRFDLPLANALAGLLGLSAFPYPPNE